MRLFVGVIQPQTSADFAAADPALDRGSERGPASVADLDGRAARHLAMLQELSQLAMQMARDVARQSAAQMARAEVVVANDHEAGDGAVAAKPVADLGVAFARVSRALHQTVAQEGRLAAELDRRERGLAVALWARAEARVRDRRARAEAKSLWHRMIAEGVERAIDADPSTGEAPERRQALVGDLQALLRADIDDCSLSLDFTPQVKAICNTLGVTLAEDFEFEPPDEAEDADEAGLGWSDPDEETDSYDSYKPFGWTSLEAQRAREARIEADLLEQNRPAGLKPGNWNGVWRSVLPDP